MPKCVEPLDIVGTLSLGPLVLLAKETSTTKSEAVIARTLSRLHGVTGPHVRHRHEECYGTSP
jgi:hypothetical protein